MKKFWSFVLVVVMVMGLACGCAKKENSEPVPSTRTETKSSTYYKTPENLKKVAALVYEYLGNGTYVETGFDNTSNLYTVAILEDITYSVVVDYGLDAQYNDICRQFQEILDCDVMIGIVNNRNEIVFASVNGVDMTYELRNAQ